MLHNKKEKCFKKVIKMASDGNVIK